MTAVWYIGPSKVRSISAAQWTAAGITGSPVDTTWSEGNGWSIPAASFTSPQLTLLAADGDFNTAGADGPRPGGAVSVPSPSQQTATRGYVDTGDGARRLRATFAAFTTTPTLVLTPGTFDQVDARSSSCTRKLAAGTNVDDEVVVKVGAISSPYTVLVMGDTGVAAPTLTPLDTVGQSVTLRWTGSAWIVAARDNPPGYLNTHLVPIVADLSKIVGPLWIRHRCDANLNPPETLEAMRASVRDAERTGNVALLEMDVHTLSDGGLALSHDDDPSTTTSLASGSLATTTTAAWLASTLKTGQPGGVWDKFPQHPTTLDAVLKEFAGRAILVIEDKDHISLPAIMAMLEAYNVPKGSVLLQSFYEDDCAAARARGWEIVALWPTTNANLDTCHADDVHYVGIDSAVVTSGFVTYAASVGIKVLPYSISRRYDRDRLLAMGCAGAFCDDVEWIAGTALRGQKSQFARGKYRSGHMANGNAAGKGVFNSDGTFSLTTGFGLHGYLMPANPDAFSFTFTGRFDSVTAADRYFEIVLTQGDLGWVDQTTPSPTTTSPGYFVLLRQNGAMEIYIVNPALGTKPRLVFINTATCTIGTYYTWTITVTATQITCKRSDNVAVAVATDSTYRGLDNLQIGCNNSTETFQDNMAFAA